MTKPCDQCCAPMTTTTWFRLSAQRRDGTWLLCSTKRCDAHPFRDHRPRRPAQLALPTR